jgi:hypothetical protein
MAKTVKRPRGARHCAGRLWAHEGVGLGLTPRFLTRQRSPARCKDSVIGWIRRRARGMSGRSSAPAPERLGDAAAGGEEEEERARSRLEPGQILPIMKLLRSTEDAEATMGFP